MNLSTLPRIFPAILLGFHFLFIGCTGVQQEPPDTFLITGTMRYLNVEGGCWYLETVEGKKYEPGGEDLHPLFVENLQVELVVRPMKGVASICQVGEPVEVLSFANLRK